MIPSSEAVSDPVPSPSSSSDHLVYAVFSTPDSSVRMSAVCAFSMQSIRDTFDKGTFKYQVRLVILFPSIDNICNQRSLYAKLIFGLLVCPIIEIDHTERISVLLQ